MENGQQPDSWKKGNPTFPWEIIPFLLVSSAACLWKTEANWSWVFPQCAREYCLSAWSLTPGCTAETASPQPPGLAASPQEYVPCRQRCPRFSNSQSLWRFCAFLCHWVSVSGCGAISGSGCSRGGPSCLRSEGPGLLGRVSGGPCCVWCHLADDLRAAEACSHREVSVVSWKSQTKSLVHPFLHGPVWSTHLLSHQTAWPLVGGLCGSPYHKRRANSWCLIQPNTNSYLSISFNKRHMSAESFHEHLENLSLLPRKISPRFLWVFVLIPH